MPPRPSVPLSRAVNHLAARKRALRRAALGMRASLLRPSASSAAKALLKVDRAGKYSFSFSGGVTNNSRMSTRRGFWARNFKLHKIANGTITVRDQEETLVRWNGNHRGN